MVLSAVLASHMGASSSYRGSTSNPAPCNRAWENRRKWPNGVGSCTHVGDPKKHETLIHTNFKKPTGTSFTLPEATNEVEQL